MPTLTRETVTRHAAAAGFTGPALLTAVAVAKAESGFNTEAHNAVPPDDSYGLWQINMLGELGTERRKKYGITNAALYDPAVNARVAYDLYKARGGFGDWSTYNNGTYKKYMGGEGGMGAPPHSAQNAAVVRPAPGKISDSYNGHSGVDIQGAIGDPIVSPVNGTVTYVGTGKGYGEAVFIRSTEGLNLVLGHCSKEYVKAGDKVTAGQHVADIGMTGNATGPHVHVEIAPNGQFNLPENAVATLQWLSGNAGTDGKTNPLTDVAAQVQAADPMAGIVKSLNTAVEVFRQSFVNASVLGVALVFIVLGIVLINRKLIGRVASRVSPAAKLALA